MQLQLNVDRVDLGDNHTGGRLYVDGEYFCDTIEDKDRRLEDGGEKIFGETCIPRGIYEVIIDHSPHFGEDLPHILNVPQFSGVRIHSGNTDKDTEGCILVGEKGTQHGDWISNSRATFAKLFKKIQTAIDEGRKIILEIT